MLQSQHDTDLIPPREMLHDGSSSAEEFVLLGEGFLQHILVPRAHLAPTAAILDLGCGNGAVARALTRFLSAHGRYEGLDINRTTIEWLQERYKAHANFRFTHADVSNSLYNPNGKAHPAQYRFPFEDSSFDLVLLKSVFTHMFPNEVQVYMREISRVLKTGGRSVITYFLLNVESRRFIEKGLDALGFASDYDGDRLCRIANPAIPEFAVAHDEQRVRECYVQTGCSVVNLEFGNWCGRTSFLGLQDLVIAVKE